MAKITKQKLANSVWRAADAIRGSIESSEFNQYLLPLVFYKYLSDRVLTYVLEIMEKPTDTLQNAQKSFEILCKDEDTEKVILKKIQEKLGYTIKPEFTFMAHIQLIQKGSFEIEHLDGSLKAIQRGHEVFRDIFEETDLRSKKFGYSIHSNNKVFSEVLQSLYSIGNMTEYTQKELGDFFEDLIGSIASYAGRKSEGFYTPKSITKVLTQIALEGKEVQPELTVYDPTMGSGSLLLSAQQYFHDPKSITFYGQELNFSTYNLARMNMFFHGVSFEKQRLRQGDTLERDWPIEEQTEFDAVLMNPPYSVKWSSEAGYLDDPRFKDYGALAPKSKADYAFLLHGYHHLNDTGTMTIILPHGVLFRGGAEGKLRQTLLEIGAIDTIIGLPSNLLYSTSIPTVIIVLKKNRSNKDVLFIDASQHFEKEKNLAMLTEKHIKAILDSYKSRKNKPKYAHVATFEELVENDYNLNIPRYVDTFEEEEVSLERLADSIKGTRQELNIVEEGLTAILQNLPVVNTELNDELANFIKRGMRSHNAV